MPPAARTTRYRPQIDPRPSPQIDPRSTPRRVHSDPKAPHTATPRGPDALTEALADVLARCWLHGTVAAHGIAVVAAAHGPQPMVSSLHPLASPQPSAPPPPEASSSARGASIGISAAHGIIAGSHDGAAAHGIFAALPASPPCMGPPPPIAPLLHHMASPKFPRCCPTANRPNLGKTWATSCQV